ncbi:MAG TPA: TSUP family transporter [Bacteriovoracaceae bacterium]|nr:TSUP family transporter [Bacteriovoracaceae bacterium]
MEYFLLPIVAFLASILTFYSGFGLGTILTPVFAVYFPLETSIAMTAIVHFLNGLFKLMLVGRHVDRNVLIRFGIPAMLAALLGARALAELSHLPALQTYQLLGKTLVISPVKLLIAVLIIVFTVVELIPKLRKLEFHQRHLSLGGFISGFFGGLSGHQGALRSAFLARAGLEKLQFLATGVWIAVMIDVARLFVYSTSFQAARITANLPLLAVTVMAAFLGAYVGNARLKKMTMKGVQTVVSVSLVLLALALGSGLI